MHKKLGELGAQRDLASASRSGEVGREGSAWEGTLRVLELWEPHLHSTSDTVKGQRLTTAKGRQWIMHLIVHTLQ